MPLSTSGFGTDNIIFVPEDGVLSVWDLVSWQWLRLDTRRLMIRPRQATVDQIVMDIEQALVDLRKKAEKRKTKVPPRIQESADAILDSLEAFAGSGGDIDVRIEAPGPEGMTWWVRITDAPVESFFPEDYAPQPEAAPQTLAFPVYGSVTLQGLAELEIPFPAEGPGAAFWLLVPARGAMTCEPIPAERSLPLVREYCGSKGVSAHGNSINIDTRGKVTANHSGCTPLTRVGSSLYTTLYFHLNTGAVSQVCAPLPSGRAPAVLEVLDRSRFEIVAASEPLCLPSWCVLRRDEDVVHLYHGLEGKESEGQHTMPDLLVVAMAGGESDPELRGQLLQQILGILR
jgi:hypothetical protein